MGGLATAPHETRRKQKFYREEMSFNGTKASSLVKRKNGLTNKNNSSGCNGVSRSGEKWRAYITLKRNQIHLGTFDSFEDASAARKEAEKGYMIQKSRLL